MKVKIKWTMFTLVLVLVILSLECNSNSMSPYGSNPSTPVKSAPNTVAMANMSFSPASMTVTKGTVVTWHNNDGVAHTSTSDNGSWDTGNILPGASKTTTFNTVGTYTYHCTVHPMMTGTVIVQ